MSLYLLTLTDLGLFLRTTLKFLNVEHPPTNYSALVCLCIAKRYWPPRAIVLLMKGVAVAYITHGLKNPSLGAYVWKDLVAIC